MIAKGPEAFVRTLQRGGGAFQYTRDDAGSRAAFAEGALDASTKELIAELNPVLRGWGHHYKRAHVRGLFHQLDGWIVQRIRSHRFKRWRNRGWKRLPEAKLYGEYGLVSLLWLIPSLASRKRDSS